MTNKVCKYFGITADRGDICSYCRTKKRVIKSWKFKFQNVRGDVDDKKRIVAAV